jgi:hypothetical protein
MCEDRSSKLELGNDQEIVTEVCVWLSNVSTICRIFVDYVRLCVVLVV